MTATLIEGKKIADKLKAELKEKIQKTGLKPKLSLILVGSDPASQVYVKKKHQACEEIGIISDQHFFAENTKEQEIIDLIIAFFTEI